MCRAVRKGGDGGVLWPKDTTSVEDVPIDLIRAVEHAFKILDWHENLMSEEVPPRWMWTLDNELEIWFEEVERKREEKFGRRKDDDELPGSSMMTNELADEIRGRR